MKANTNNKHSAKKKLIPAVAMLTTSAIMLSTATYAWFTLNKEVEVTGLKMAATAGDSLEISLGSINGSGEYTTTAPDVDDTSWKRAITIDEYYASVGRLKPVSSNSATTLYKVADLGIVQGGRAVTPNTEITAAGSADAAELVLDKDSAEENKTFKTVDDPDSEGYYIDVPMWIRTNNRPETDTPIDCTVTITDPTKDEADNTGSDLIKAVRVAIIPAGTANTSSGIAAITPTVTDGVAQVGGGLTTSIYALDDTTYNEKKVIGATGNYNVASLVTTTLNKAAAERVDTALDSDTELDNANTTPLHTVFNLPAATADDYAGAAFIARIWIEGESAYCNDATANQDWLIDFHFNICDSANDTTDHDANTFTVSP